MRYLVVYHKWFMESSGFEHEFIERPSLESAHEYAYCHAHRKCKTFQRCASFVIEFPDPNKKEDESLDVEGLIEVLKTMPPKMKVYKSNDDQFGDISASDVFVDKPFKDEDEAVIIGRC